jgi:hypothetical protein
MKILYNDCYGIGFSFSEAFIAEFETRTGRKIHAHKVLFQRGPGSIRCDPVAIAIVEEKGSAWASEPGSHIAIYEISDVFERYWEIEENEGDEYVRVLVSEALADILHTFMETGDEATMRKQYTAINGSYHLKQSTSDTSNDIHTYFGVTTGS